VRRGARVPPMRRLPARERGRRPDRAGEPRGAAPRMDGVLHR
jgi:hypothetical protein